MNFWHGKCLESKDHEFELGLHGENMRSWAKDFGGWLTKFSSHPVQVCLLIFISGALHARDYFNWPVVLERGTLPCSSVISLLLNPTTICNSNTEVKSLGSTTKQRQHLGEGAWRGVFLIPCGEGSRHLPIPAEICLDLLSSHTLHHKPLCSQGILCSLAVKIR